MKKSSAISDQAAPNVGIRQSTINLLRPVPPRNSYEFVTKYLRTPPGKPFNAHDYPWVKGICDAYDMDSVRQITLQMAARLGKSMTAQALMVAGVAHDPDVGMIAMSTKKLLEETVEDKYYPILQNTNITRNLIPAEHNRNKHEISIGSIKLYGAWSGSTTTLADKPPKYKHAGEVDKWEVAASREADSLKLFMERGIEIPDRKSIIESTPDLAQTSRIEGALLSGWNCRFMIPCPLCGERIQLIPGDGKDESTGGTGGVKFDFLNGKPNVYHAYKTARYVCQECAGEWGDQWRRTSILKGVWVPEGCIATPDGTIKGEMSGDPENASFQLSRLYAPTFKFGDIARQICKCIIDPDEWQTTRNSWFGITHSYRASSLTWEETAKRLSTISYNMGQVPASGIFLTVGIDVQQDHFVFVVVAWGKHGVGWIVDYGTAWNVQDIRKILMTEYDHLDGGPKIRQSMALMDSGEGDRQDEIIDICRLLNYEKGPWLWPCKGSSSNLPSGTAYRKQTFDEMADKRKKHARLHGLAGFFHVTVNTPWTQTWMHKALFYRNPGEPKSISIPQDATADEDFMLQLINERREGVDTTTGHGSSRWVVVDETIPWDFRDAVRYARTAAEIFTRSAWIRIPLHRRITARNLKSGKSTDEPLPEKNNSSASSKNSTANESKPPKPAKPAKSGGKQFMRSGSRRKISDRFIRRT